MVLCLAMLVGATFAWFTDTASTGVNKIQAGNLDIEIQDENGKPVTNLSWVKAEGAEGEQVLWEPGCTYKLPELRVVNKGNLALKYKVAITGINGSAKLNTVIDWTSAMWRWALSSIWRPVRAMPSPSRAICRSPPATST